MAIKNGGKTFFWQKVEDESAYTLRVENFVEIALYRIISEINSLLGLTQKLKMATKNGRITIFGKKCRVYHEGKNFVAQFLKY